MGEACGYKHHTPSHTHTGTPRHPGRRTHDAYSRTVFTDTVVNVSRPNRFHHNFSLYLEWLGSRVVSVLDSGAEGPGSNRSRDAVG